MVQTGINHCVTLMLGVFDSSATVVECQDPQATLMAMFVSYWQPAAWSEEERSALQYTTVYKTTGEV